MAFRITARRNRLLGQWAAAQMKPDPEETDAYAKAVVQADFEEAGDEDVIRKLVSDLNAAGIELDEGAVRRGDRGPDDRGPPPAHAVGITEMPMAADEIEALITRGIPDARVEITDLAGDGDHYAARVTSESFRGLPRIKQHQAVYAALGGRMGGVLHALQLTTAVPE